MDHMTGTPPASRVSSACSCLSLPSAVRTVTATTTLTTGVVVRDSLHVIPSPTDIDSLVYHDGDLLGSCSDRDNYCLPDRYRHNDHDNYSSYLDSCCGYRQFDHHGNKSFLPSDFLFHAADS